MTPAILMGFVLLLLGMAVASPAAIDCVAREARISVKPLAQQELDIEGRTFLYGIFTLSNKSGKPIRVLADVGGQKYWIVAPNSSSLQRREGNSWVDDFVALSEYLGFDKKVTIPADGEWQLIYPLDVLIINKVSQAQEYRLVLTDVDRCSIASEAFTLESLRKSAPAL
ncbi:hypothetical protein [Dyella sp. 2RAB6]|uniref:hypothetical protein n=1 Tax=Dyella sp. 2RAB6 TaxID=3232992 RepID=UPI003F8EADB1